MGPLLETGSLISPHLGRALLKKMLHIFAYGPNLVSFLGGRKSVRSRLVLTTMIVCVRLIQTPDFNDL
jgi:hypothetical protein